MSNSEVFLEIAKTDLKAAECLYEQALYPQAIFSLQQAVEKMTKAFGALSLDMTPEVMKKEIGHFPFQVFLCTLQRAIEPFITKNKSTSDNSIVNTAQQNSTNHMDEIRQIEKILKKFMKLDNFSTYIITAQLTPILMQIRSSNASTELDSDLDNFAVSVEKFLDQQHDQIIIDNKDRICSMVRKILQDMMHIVNPLVFLVIALPSNCVQNTRYPMDKSNPLQLYNIDHPLVKSFDNIAEVCTFTLERIENILKTFQRMDYLGEKGCEKSKKD